MKAKESVGLKFKDFLEAKGFAMTDLPSLWGYGNCRTRTAVKYPFDHRFDIVIWRPVSTGILIAENNAAEAKVLCYYDKIDKIIYDLNYSFSSDKAVTSSLTEAELNWSDGDGNCHRLFDLRREVVSKVAKKLYTYAFEHPYLGEKVSENTDYLPRMVPDLCNQEFISGNSQIIEETCENRFKHILLGYSPESGTSLIEAENLYTLYLDSPVEYINHCFEKYIKDPDIQKMIAIVGATTAMARMRKGQMATNQDGELDELTTAKNICSSVEERINYDVTVTLRSGIESLKAKISAQDLVKSFTHYGVLRADFFMYNSSRAVEAFANNNNLIVRKMDDFGHFHECINASVIDKVTYGNKTLYSKEEREN